VNSADEDLTKMPENPPGRETRIAAGPNIAGACRWGQISHLQPRNRRV
jgi:hypothetical protein